MKKEDHVHIDGRVSYRGWALEFPPPPQEILKLSTVTIVLSQALNNNLVPDYVRSNLNSNFVLGEGGGGGGGGGGGMPPDPPSRHTCLRVCEGAFARYYHPATILFPPNSKSCMKPWTAKSLLCLTLSSVLHSANG